MTKVLHVLAAAPQIGGLELSFARLAPALLECDVQSKALLIGTDEGSAAVLAQHLPVLRTQDRSAIEGALRDTDVIHMHGASCTTWPREVPRLAKRARRPLVFTIHLPRYPPIGSWSPGRVRVSAQLLAYGLYLARTTTRVVAPSDAAAAMARRRFGPWLRVTRFLYGVPDHGPSAMPTGPLRLAFVGRLDLHKQPLVFVESVAAAVARGVDVHAEMAGDGSQADEVRALIKARGLENRITLLGRIEHPDPLLRRSHVLVFTSDAEGCPVSAIEAAAVGRGVICREGIEGLTELWGRASVLVAPDAGPDEFADAYVEMAGDLDGATVMGVHARRLFEAEFDDRVAAGRWAALYAEAAAIAR